MDLISILCIFFGLTILLLSTPMKSAPIKFYLFGAIIYYPLFWLLGIFLIGDSIQISRSDQIAFFLIFHLFTFVIISAFLWNFLGLERHFLNSMNRLKDGSLDRLLMIITIIVYGITIFRFYSYGFLISGVTPIYGLETYFILPYWDTILLSLQAIMLPIVIIWPLLRINFYKENSISNKGVNKFRFLLLIAFLLAFTSGRSAIITFLVFLFLFGNNYRLRNNYLPIKQIFFGFVIVILSSYSFYFLRLSLNDQLEDYSSFQDRLISNIGTRSFDIISFADEVLESETVARSGPYLINSYNRLLPSFLIEDCSSYFCPEKVTLEKAVLEAMDIQDTDKPETFFLATIVDKSFLLFIFYPVALAFFISLELFLIAKFSSQKSIYFMIAYCHLAYSLLKIESDAAWYLFHARDTLLLFILLYFLTYFLKLFNKLFFSYKRL